jgi:hypothetical protein
VEVELVLPKLRLVVDTLGLTLWFGDALDHPVSDKSSMGVKNVVIGS